MERKRERGRNRGVKGKKLGLDVYGRLEGMVRNILFQKAIAVWKSRKRILYTRDVIPQTGERAWKLKKNGFRSNRVGG